MSDLESSFLTFTQLPSDPGFMGYEAEMNAMHLRTDALDRFLRNEEKADVLLDMLAEHGQDPAAYVRAVQQQVNSQVGNQINPNEIDFWLNLRNDC